MEDKNVFKKLKIKKLSIVGVIPSFAFQRAKFCAMELHRKLPYRFPLPEIVGMLELDWNEKLLNWKRTFGREYWCLRRPVAVFFDDQFIGSDLELIKLVSIGNIFMESIPHRNNCLIKENFRKDYLSYLKKNKRIYCYLDICVDDVYVGTLTFELYSDIVPKTCENFKTLCLGNRGPLLCYKGSRIHRIVKEGWLQGGDIQYKTGGGGFSIFCNPLENENFGISHDRRGVLSMANCGRNTNGSQFFVTLRPSKWMDTNFVAFGQVMEGVRVLKLLENMETMYQCPLKKIEIKNCGKLDLGDDEDVDIRYREEPLPKKKPKKIETISEQIVRLILEALTSALAKKEYAPDILDEGDVPSKMNLQLYFQGFYSLPESILEDVAKYIRKLRRELFRTLKPSATEIVEVLMYDLQLAVLTRMTTLDDVKETIGHELYQKMINGIDMNMELCQKPYVKKLVDQIVDTAENMVDLISKKILGMKQKSKKLKHFQDKMQNWVQSFVLQETFKGDNYHISDRPPWDFVAKRYIKRKKKEEKKEEEKEYLEREGVPCCEREKQEKLKAEMEKLKKFPPEDVCCLGLELLEMSEIQLSDYFKTCRYDLKRIPKNEEVRMPLLDLIEISRFKLKWMRKQENRVRSEDRLCLEKKIRKWMKEVVYTPESSWITDVVYGKEEMEIYDHVEEIMYGAMTAGLLEMYYFMEQYLKLCGGKKQKIVTRTIYPEDSDVIPEMTPKWPEDSETESLAEVQEENNEEDMKIEKEEEKEEEKKEEKEEKTKPCTCGHPCCVCPSEPIPPSTPPPSLEEEDLGEVEEAETIPSPPPPPSSPSPPPPPQKPCPSDMELVDLNTFLAEKTCLDPEEIDIRSFKWLKPYILEKGCDLKTEFATQAHKWLDGERFNYNGFISKHSLVTKASLLSLSISLAGLLKEENEMKSEIKNFVYDLWDLYFNEMFNEALLEYPPEEEEEEIKKQEEEEEEEEEREEEERGEEKSEEMTDEQICKKVIEQTPEFDFSTYCKKFGHNIEDSTKEIDQPPQEEMQNEKEDENPTTFPEPIPEKPKPKMSKPEKQTPKNEEPQEPPEEPSDEPPEVPEKMASEMSQMFPEKFEEYLDDEIKDKGTAEDGGSGSNNEEAQKEVEGIKKRKSPYVVEEVIEVSSGEESRDMPPYVLPFWVKFLTELTKQALGALAKVSRLPRRLYFGSDSDIAFDDKMKEWFEFNAFNPQPTKGREIMDYIALHHRSLTNLEDTARSYLRKKKYSELLNRCSRITSADDMAQEIVADVLGSALDHTEEKETLEIYVSNLVSSAVAGTPDKSEMSFADEYSFETDQQESQVSIEEQ